MPARKRRSTSRRRKPPGRKGNYVGYRKLKRKLSRRKGVRNAGALAAHIGRKKYGKKKMARFAAAGRRKKARRKRR